MVVQGGSRFTIIDVTRVGAGICDATTPSHDLIVCGLPQLNSVDCDYFILLINLIKHPVLSFSDPIPVPPSSQLRNTLWKGVVYQPLNVSIDSDVRLIVKSIEILLCALLDPDLIHPVSTCASDIPHNPSFLRFSAIQNP